MTDSLPKGNFAENQLVNVHLYCKMMHFSPKWKPFWLSFHFKKEKTEKLALKFLGE